MIMMMRNDIDLKRFFWGDIFIKLLMILMLLLTLTQQIQINSKIDELSKDEIIEDIRKGNDDLLELSKLESDILSLKYTLSTMTINDVVDDNE